MKNVQKPEKIHLGKLIEEIKKDRRFGKRNTIKIMRQTG